MIDSITGTIIATLITSVVTLFVGLLTHIKSSKCGNMDIEFTNTNTSTTANSTINSVPIQENSTKITK